MGWVRHMGEAKNTPIIIISADLSTKARQHALSAGAVAFFSKPIDRFALLDTIRATLGQNTVAPVPVAA